MISTKQKETSGLVPLGKIKAEQMFYLQGTLRVCAEQGDVRAVTLNLQNGVVTHYLNTVMVLAAGEFHGCDEVREEGDR